VRQNVERLAGTIEIDSRIGEGTRFRIKIPLTLAIIQALLVRVGDEIFTIPLTAVEETLRISREEVTTIEGVECIYLRNSTLSLLRLSELFGIASASRDGRRAFVVVVNTGMRRVGLVVDALIGQEETVIKPLVDYLQESSGFSGATILGDGRISLILDVHELIKLSIGIHARAKHQGEMPDHGEISCGRKHLAAASAGRLH
jgi:two-component system chemotaxis sensor kinase CheA